MAWTSQKVPKGANKNMLKSVKTAKNCPKLQNPGSSKSSKKVLQQATWKSVKKYQKVPKSF